MNATSLYVNVCRNMFSSDPEDPSNWNEIGRQIQKLRQSLTCRVCREVCINPYSSDLCQHLVCKNCLTDKQPHYQGCRWCKNTDDLSEDKQNQIVLTCYKKICELIAESPLARVNIGQNGGRNRVWTILQEGMNIPGVHIVQDDFAAASSSGIQDESDVSPVGPSCDNFGEKTAWLTANQDNIEDDERIPDGASEVNKYGVLAEDCDRAHEDLHNGMANRAVSPPTATVTVKSECDGENPVLQSKDMGESISESEVPEFTTVANGEDSQIEDDPAHLLYPSVGDKRHKHKLKHEGKNEDFIKRKKKKKHFKGSVYRDPPKPGKKHKMHSKNTLLVEQQSPQSSPSKGVLPLKIRVRKLDSDDVGYRVLCQEEMNGEVSSSADVNSGLVNGSIDSDHMDNKVLNSTVSDNNSHVLSYEKTPKKPKNLPIDESDDDFDFRTKYEFPKKCKLKSNKKLNKKSKSIFPKMPQTVLRRPQTGKPKKSKCACGTGSGVKYFSDICKTARCPCFAAGISCTTCKCRFCSNPHKSRTGHKNSNFSRAWLTEENEEELEIVT